MQAIVYFVGIDDWGRPVFKEVNGQRYFCDTEHLFRNDITEKEILEKYDSIGTGTICYKGKGFYSEPEGDSAEVEIVPSKIQTSKKEKKFDKWEITNNGKSYILSDENTMKMIFANMSGHNFKDRDNDYKMYLKTLIYHQGLQQGTIELVKNGKVVDTANIKL